MIVLRFLKPGEECLCINCGFRPTVPGAADGEEAGRDQRVTSDARYRRYKITLAVFAAIHFFALLWYVTPSYEWLLSVMQEPKFGGVAVEPLRRMGVDALPAIKEQTVNFADLGPRSARRMARIASSYPREIREQVLREMAEQNRTGRPWTYLIAIGELGSMGVDCSDEAGRIMELMKSPETSWLREEGATALGLIGAQEAVPFLAQLLLGEQDKGFHEEAAVIEALGRLGDKKAIDAIKTSLPRMSVYEIRYAVAALLRLGDRSGIDLAISSLEGDHGRKDEFAHLLRQYTGQEYGVDKHAWEAWWKSAEDDYIIPSIEPDYYYDTGTPSETSLAIMVLGIYTGIVTACLAISVISHRKRKLLNRVNAFFISIILVPAVVYLTGALIDLLALPYRAFFFGAYIYMSILFILWCILLIPFIYYLIITVACAVSRRYSISAAGTQVE